MKNEDIHDEFEEQEIRDFLAKSLTNIRRIGTVVDIDYIKGEIKKYQEMLKYAQVYQGAKFLIKSKGWDEFDVSDDIPYDKESYFPFIGTEDEYNKLIKRIKS